MPKFSYWWITAIHRETREERLSLCKFHGPMPLKHELEYYCPPDICVITEMKFSWNSDEWTDSSEEGQQTLFEEMKDCRNVGQN